MLLVEYHNIFRYFFIIFLFLVDEVCPICRKTCFDIFGEHAVHYREFVGFKYRHDFIRDVMFNIFWWDEVSLKKEVFVKFFTDPQNRISAINVLVYE